MNMNPKMMEDFSGLALPPLFGGNILEAELEAEGVELTSGGTEILQSEASAQEEQKRDETRDREKKKYHLLNKRVKEMEQVNEKILARLHQVQRLTRRLKKERRFLMKSLDAYSDDYRNAELTVTLEGEGVANLDSTPGGEDDGSSPSVTNQSVKKKRHRVLKEKERDTRAEADRCVMADAPFPAFPSPNSLSH